MKYFLEIAFGCGFLLFALGIWCMLSVSAYWSRIEEQVDALAAQKKVQP